MTNQEIEEKINEYNTNGKKTICLFCDVFYPSIDGVISVVNNLAINLAKTYNVAVCVPKHKGKIVSKNEYLVLGAHSTKVPGMDYECSLTPAADKQFAKFLKMLKIDLVHFHSPFFMGKFAIKFAKKRNIPIVASMHSLYKNDFWQNTHSHILTKILTKNMVKVFNSADMLFTMNDFCEKTFRSYGITKPITLIGNATNMPSGKNEQAVEKINKVLGISQSDNLWLYVGRLVKVKSLPMTIDALKELKDKGHKFKFVFVGEGSQKKKLIKQVQKLRLSENVVFMGKIMDKTILEGLYSRANLFVFTSSYDTEGIVVIEAAAKETPSIVVARSGPASRIIDGENGFVAEHTAHDFAEKIHEICENRKNLQEIGKNANKSLYITWEEITQKYIPVYEQLTKKNDD